MIGFTKDSTVWDMMKANIKKDADKELKIGVFPESTYGSENDNLPVAQVLKWQEEGTQGGQGNGSGIPPRPAMRAVGNKIKVNDKYKALFKKSIESIAEGKTTFAQEYTIMGVFLKGEMKQTIEDWFMPPNSPSTIAQKGFNDPLIETRTMVNSIDFKVEKGD